MPPHYDPIQIAVDSQLGGFYSQNPSNPEFLIISSIDQKYRRGNTLTKKIIILVLQGYTQAEIGAFLRISRRQVGRLMSKIPVSDPYIVGGMKRRVAHPEPMLSQMRWRKVRHLKSDPYPDARSWTPISEGGYLKRKFQTFDKHLEQE